MSDDHTPEEDKPGYIRGKSDGSSWEEAVAKQLAEQGRRIIVGVDFGGEQPSIAWCEEDQGSTRFLGGTASVVHDGSWEFERRQLERRAREAACPEEPRYLTTVWGRPRGLRGLYLAARRGVWNTTRAVRRHLGIDR